MRNAMVDAAGPGERAVTLARTRAVPMTTMVEPITEQEFVGYLAAMLGDRPLGDPAVSPEE